HQRQSTADPIAQNFFAAKRQMTTKLAPTDRFSDRVENYIKYRPRYPDTLLPLLVRELSLNPSHVIADIGCGPGQSSEPFLRNGISRRVRTAPPAVRHRLFPGKTRKRR